MSRGVLPQGNEDIGSVQDFGIWKMGQQLCSIASREWDVSRVKLHKFDIRFLVLLDSRSCRKWVAQWLARENPTTDIPVRFLGRQNIHPSNFFGTVDRLTVFWEIFCKIFCEISSKVEHVAYQHHWLFWNMLKILLWVNLGKNNHYFNQKQPISINLVYLFSGD